MKGAKRVLSVFLLVVMLCTFFAFPAEAATNYWPSLSSWNLGSDNISLISGGTAFDLAGSNPSNKGVAMGDVLSTFSTYFSQTFGAILYFIPFAVLVAVSIGCWLLTKIIDVFWR